MHKIAEKEFTLEDFSTEHLIFDDTVYLDNHIHKPSQEFSSNGNAMMKTMCDLLNQYREKYLKTKDKDYWWQMIQLLPSSYNQTRNVMMNYETLANIYKSRKNHKLDEWRELCKWIESLPYSELITDIEAKDQTSIDNLKSSEKYLGTKGCSLEMQREIESMINNSHSIVKY